MKSTEWFNRIWDIPPKDVVVMEPVDYTWWYGKSALTPVLKDHCSYCGLVIENPYLQHDDCIKMQIELKKEPSPKRKDSATVDVCKLAIDDAWSHVVLNKFYAEGPVMDGRYATKQ